MTRIIRQTIYFLVITLEINAGGWTFNREAVADAFLEAPQTVQADDAATAAQPGEEKASVKGFACNHWCHAVGHFVGIFYLQPTLPMRVTGDYFVSKRFIALPSLPEGLYRPPRFFS